LDLKTVARTLGARYIVEGSVRQAADQLRINVQLIDANLDRHLWSHRFDAQLKDIFAVQDKITEQVVTQIVPEVRRTEIEFSAHRHKGGVDYWVELNRGIWNLNLTLQDDAIIKKAIIDKVDDMLSPLNEREKDIIRKRFGIGINTTYTLSEIGEMYNVTRERVRQIEKNALNKIASSKVGKDLRNYI